MSNDLAFTHILISDHGCFAPTYLQRLEGGTFVVTPDINAAACIEDAAEATTIANAHGYLVKRVKAPKYRMFDEDKNPVIDVDNESGTIRVTFTQEEILQHANTVFHYDFVDNDMSEFSFFEQALPALRGLGYTLEVKEPIL